MCISFLVFVLPTHGKKWIIIFSTTFRIEGLYLQQLHSCLLIVDGDSLSVECEHQNV